MSDLLITCRDCPRSEQITWLPMQWHATCALCAETSVSKHLQTHPTHRCTVTGNEESA